MVGGNHFSQRKKRKAFEARARRVQGFNNALAPAASDIPDKSSFGFYVAAAFQRTPTT